MAGVNPFPGGAQQVNMGLRQGVQQPQMPSQVGPRAKPEHTQLTVVTEPERPPNICSLYVCNVCGYSDSVKIRW